MTEPVPHEPTMDELKHRAVYLLMAGVSLSRQLGFDELQELLEVQVQHIPMMRQTEEVQSVIDIATYRNSRLRARIVAREEKKHNERIN